MSTTSIDSVEALYRKLERTFHRRAAYGDQQLDWVFDTSITAWHLVDWTAHARGLPLSIVQAAFKAQCPELAVCEQLCNGAKHRVLTNPNLQPFDVATHVQITVDRAGISRMNVMPGDQNIDVILTTCIAVRDKNGTTWDALRLFLVVMQFWSKELCLPLGAG